MAKIKDDDDTILVPVDLSPISENVLAFAASLAEPLKKKLVVLHVVHDPGEAPGYYKVKGRKKVLQRLEDVAQEMLDEFLEQARQRHADSRCIKSAQALLVVGLPATRILEVVERIHPWMVVIGSKGRTGLSHVLLGSKAEQVARLCPVPVTIIKDDNSD